jgi:DNA-binding beta-propeller fold protein YncE
MGHWLTGRGAKALGVSLAVGLGMTACSRDYTVAYLYVTSATKTTMGDVNAYAIDYQSGALTPLADSPIPSGGNNPVGLAATPNGKYVYVINQSAPTSNLVPFSVGTDGKLYPVSGGTIPVVQNAAGTVIGSFPTAIAVDPTGTFLYITFLYQNGFSTTNPGPGGIAIYPIDDATGKVGAPLVNTTVGTTAANPLPYVPVGDNPIGLVVDPHNANVYVVDQESPQTNAANGQLLSFAVTTSTTGEPLTPSSANVMAGTTPGGIAEDPGGHFLYVTDEATNQIYFYLTNGGKPVGIYGSPLATGSFPRGVTVDPRGMFAYVANFGSSTVSAYAINQATGTLSGVAGTAATTVGPGPTCVAIEPALGIYTYTSNYVDNTVSGLQLNPHTGALTTVQGTVFSAAALPTCAVAVANGAHATQIVE